MRNAKKEIFKGKFQCTMLYGGYFSIENTENGIVDIESMNF